jgi:predicted aspartyl protease
MARALAFVGGILVGQWLAFGGLLAPADVLERVARAVERGGEVESGGGWRRAVSPSTAREGLASPAGLPLEPEVAIPLESALGVWVVEASLNGGPPSRFLVDTGSSVVIVAPRVAAVAGVTAAPRAPRIELQTVAGRSSGPAVRVRSVRVGGLELRDVPMVLHDPGPGFDGILGNAVLSQYQLTLDPDRHLLVLRLLEWAPRRGPHIPEARPAPVRPSSILAGAPADQP